MRNINFASKLNNLDLRSLTNHLMSSSHEGYNWNIEQTETAIARYKMFLWLQFLFPNTGLVPTPEIDRVWHTHILQDTYRYQQDCLDLYGYFLHHRSHTTAIDEHQQTAFTLTKTLFEQVFGIGTLSDINDNHQGACITLQAACVTLPKTPENAEKPNLQQPSNI
jgi:hypothetical protein